MWPRLQNEINNKERTPDYDSGVYKELSDQIQKGLAACTPSDADVAALVDVIVKVVEMPFGKRPFRVHIDPAQDDGSEIVNALADRILADFLHGIGLGNLLLPQVEDN
jgi:hypothetical protein